MRSCFARCVVANFKFLEHGAFALHESQPTLVEYRKDDIGIRIFYGRRSHEIGAELLFPNQLQTPISLETLLWCFMPEIARKYKQFATHSEAGIEEGVKKLALIWTDVLNAGILNRPNLLAELLDTAKLRRTEFTSALNLRRARAQADVAWREKKFSEVVRILKPVATRLSKAELARLTYAEKHSI